MYNGSRDGRQIEVRLNDLLEERASITIGDGIERALDDARLEQQEKPATTASTAPPSAPTSQQRAEKGGSSTRSWPLGGRVHQ